MYLIHYKKEERLYTVGCYDFEGLWYAMRDCDSPDEAHAFINYLNGGKGNPFPGSD